MLKKIEFGSIKKLRHLRKMAEVGKEKHEVEIEAQVFLLLHKSNWNMIQKKIVGFNNLIDPYYRPRISVEDVDDAQILVIWVPAGINRDCREMPKKFSTFLTS